MPRRCVKTDLINTSDANCVHLEGVHVIHHLYAATLLLTTRKTFRIKSSSYEELSLLYYLVPVIKHLRLVGSHQAWSGRLFFAILLSLLGCTLPDCQNALLPVVGDQYFRMPYDQTPMIEIIWYINEKILLRLLATAVPLMVLGTQQPRSRISRYRTGIWRQQMAHFSYSSVIMISSIRYDETLVPYRDTLVFEKMVIIPFLVCQPTCSSYRSCWRSCLKGCLCDHFFIVDAFVKLHVLFSEDCPSHSLFVSLAMEITVFCLAFLEDLQNRSVNPSIQNKDEDNFQAKAATHQSSAT